MEFIYSLYTGLAPGHVQHLGHDAGVHSPFPQGNVELDTVTDHEHDLQPLLQATLVGKLFNTTKRKTKCWSVHNLFSCMFYLVEYPKSMILAVICGTYKVLMLRCGRLICSSTPQPTGPRHIGWVWGPLARSVLSYRHNSCVALRQDKL